MTTSRAKSGVMIFGALGTLGVLMAAALGADTADLARETFAQTAERWGIWAAVSISLVLVSVVGLFMVVRFTLTTMRDCIDDNSLSHLHLSRVLLRRPCLHDSDSVTPPDVQALEADKSTIGDTARRVLARRKGRERHAE